MVTEGTFRADLYYRLTVYTIRLPAIRDRGDDLPLLAEHLVRRFGGSWEKRYGACRRRRWTCSGSTHGRGTCANSRVIKQTLLRTTGPVILPEFLPTSVRTESVEPAFDFGGLTAFVEDRLKANATALYAEYLALTDRHLLTLVLRHTEGNLSRAAQVLGITRGPPVETRRPRHSE